MAQAGAVYYAVIDIINEVRKLLQYNTVTRLDADKYCDVHLRLLNQIVDEISNYGDWPELYATCTVPVKASVYDYTMASAVNPVTDPVQRVYEVAFENQRQPLYFISIQEFNMLRRGSQGSTGNPRQYTIRGTDQFGNPKISVHMMPGRVDVNNIQRFGQGFNITYYMKVGTYDKTTADNLVPFPANMVIAGLYATALVEESGGAMTKEAQDAYATFKNLMERSQQRHTTDTDVDTRLVPMYRGR